MAPGGRPKVVNTVCSKKLCLSQVSNFAPTSETKWVKQFIEFISAVQNCLSFLADFTMCKEKKLKGGRKKNYQHQKS